MFKVQSSGFQVPGSEFRVQISGLADRNLSEGWFQVSGSGFRVSGFNFLALLFYSPHQPCTLKYR